jgi:hypothetical protein
MWIEIVALAKRFQPELYQHLLSFPDDLPDLSTLLPPGGNSRSDGMAASYFEKRMNGTLPEMY